MCLALDGRRQQNVTGVCSTMFNRFIHVNRTIVVDSEKDRRSSAWLGTFRSVTMVLQYFFFLFYYRPSLQVEVFCMLNFLITTLWITGFALVLFPSAPTLSLPSLTRCLLFALRRRCCTIKVSHVTASGRQPCRYYQIPLFHLHASLNEERVHFAQLAIHEIAAAATKNRPDTRLKVNNEEDDDNNECCIQLLIFVACCLSWRLFFLQDASINKPRLAPNRRFLPPRSPSLRMTNQRIIY